jgi:hypothetical protein
MIGYLTVVGYGIGKSIQIQTQFITNLIKFRTGANLFCAVFVHSQWQYKFLGGQSEVGIWLLHY